MNPCNAFFQTDFVTTIQKRGAAVIAARKMSSAMSAAKAATDHMHDWYVLNNSVQLLTYHLNLKTYHAIG